MKTLVGLLFALAVLFSGPSVCAHAMASDAPMASMNMSMPADHAAMGHAMMPDEASAPADDAGHCPDGCDGGADCQGCVSLVPALLTPSPVAVSDSPARVYAGLRETLASSHTAFDPPPPRHLILS